MTSWAMVLRHTLMPKVLNPVSTGGRVGGGGKANARTLRIVRTLSRHLGIGPNLRVTHTPKQKKKRKEKKRTKQKKNATERPFRRPADHALPNTRLSFLVRLDEKVAADCLPCSSLPNSLSFYLFTSQKAALGRQEFYAKLYEILCYLRFFSISP